MQFQHRAGSEDRSGTNAIDELIDAIQKYFNLMYDCNIANFADVFSPTAQLHGYRDGKMVCWPAAEYKEVLKARQSPLSLGSPRQDSVLLIDIASASHAFAKVEVRIHAGIYHDYLTYHKIDGRWIITSKGYHLMRTV
jgi:putative lumazine-binding protein